MGNQIREMGGIIYQIVFGDWEGWKSKFVAEFLVGVKLGGVLAPCIRSYRLIDETLGRCT
jgi:hypothetical protein